MAGLSGAGAAPARGGFRFDRFDRFERCAVRADQAELPQPRQGGLDLVRVEARRPAGFLVVLGGGRALGPERLAMGERRFLVAPHRTAPTDR